MCGICGSVERNGGATEIVRDVLIGLQNRGLDSWGIGYERDGRVETYKEVGKPNKAVALPDSRVALGHNRWATHGGVCQENAHPHTGCTTEFVLVQNGQIRNHSRLKASHGTEHKYVSGTDTEVGAHEIEIEMKKLRAAGVTDSEEQSVLLRGFREAFKKFEGANAMVVSNGRELVAGGKEKSLIAGQTETGFILSSDPNSILSKTRRMYFLNDGETVSLNGSAMLYREGSDIPEEVPFQETDWTHKIATLDTDIHPYHMHQEMHESADRLRRLLENPKQSEAVASYLEGVTKLYGVGCGTAYHAGMVASEIFAEVAGIELTSYTATQFGSRQRFLTRKSAVLWLSQSGETTDVLNQVRQAKLSEAKHVAILNQEGSALYREVPNRMMIDAGLEIAVAATTSFTNKLGALYLLAHRLNGTYTEGERVIERVARGIEGLVGREDEIAQLAKEYAQNEHMFIMGPDTLSPIALEMALKIKEITYIHAEGYGAADLKHGVIALIEDGRPSIALVPSGESEERVLSSASQVKARGSKVLGVGPNYHPNEYSHHFAIPNIGQGTEIVMNFFGQMLAYHMTLERGLNPDEPRNLAKTVTVE